MIRLIVKRILSMKKALFQSMKMKMQKVPIILMKIVTVMMKVNDSSADNDLQTSNASEYANDSDSASNHESGSNPIARLKTMGKVSFVPMPRFDFKYKPEMFEKESHYYKAMASRFKWEDMRNHAQVKALSSLCSTLAKGFTEGYRCPDHNGRKFETRFTQNGT